MPQSPANISALSIVIAAFLAMAGCAQPVVVKPGDMVDISFTCRLKDGSLAATTLPDPEVSGEPKSPAYLPRNGGDSVAVTAGPQPEAAEGQSRLPFEQEIIKRLGPLLPGTTVGQQPEWELAAERYQSATSGNSIVRMASVRKRRKEMRISREEYTARTGKAPEQGQPFVIDPLVPGTVGEVSEKEVLIRFSPVRDKGIALPFGPVTVNETPEDYELVIAPEKGRLVRAGGMVGRIADVEGDLFALDFGHPFGGEKLDCRVRVAGVKRPALSAPAAQVTQVNPVDKTDMTNTADVADRAAVSASLLEDAGKFQQKNPLTSGKAEPGDLAVVEYSALLEDGSLFYATRKAEADDPAVKKAAWFSPPKIVAGEAVTVGKNALLPGIGEAVAGMAVGEKKRLTLPPDRGFGPADPKRIEKLPLVRTLPKTITMPADEYVKRFDGFPSVGLEVPLTPYFPARVTAVRQKEVELEFMAEDGASFNEPFGVTSVKVEGASITTTLRPVVGGLFPVQGGYGIISDSDATTFSVDTNNPLAGRTITIDLELTGLTRAADLPSGDLPWLEDHDTGLAIAKKDGKPAVLVLYADWCGFCKKLFSETMPDPRIGSLRDRFAWIRVNSDKQTEVKKLYGQEGYPVLVLFRADGSVARKLDGYQEASVLRAALQELY